MHFLREELKEKSVLLRSLIITSNNQRNKSSEKTSENLVPNFPSKTNSDHLKEHLPPIKDDVTDFCIDGTATKSDNTEKENGQTHLKSNHPNIQKNGEKVPL